ncbi:MAG TPA: 50S ribosomal protein L31 [Gammaproteobacteria bacterium]|nr:50S ribosomal protein L31 [Gammaproteobacteria bacterium]
MKPDIHPQYASIQVTCSCGHVFNTGSALGKDLNVEVCNKCHPFYTGKTKIVDTAGRVDKFSKKFGGFALNKNQSSDDKKADESAED